MRASARVLGRASATLLGAAADRGSRDALRAGRLTEEREAPGFGILTGTLAGVDSGRRPAPGGEPPRRAGRAGEERRDGPAPGARPADVVRLERDARRRQAEREARRRVEILAREAEAREAAAKALTERAEGAGAAVEALRRRLAAARREAREAARAPARARRDAERARRAVAREARRVRR